jgi:hypothetical protein
MRRNQIAAEGASVSITRIAHRVTASYQDTASTLFLKPVGFPFSEVFTAFISTLHLNFLFKTGILKMTFYKCYNFASVDCFLFGAGMFQARVDHPHQYTLFGNASGFQPDRK